jgi:hypothetical protein
MSEKSGMDALDRMVERVLAYKPAKVRKKQKKRKTKPARRKTSDP